MNRALVNAKRGKRGDEEEDALRVRKKYLGGLLFFLWCNKDAVSFWWVFAGATPPWLREDDDDEEGASADNHVIGPSFDAFKKHGKFTRYPWSLCSLVESQVLWPVCHLILSSPLKSEERLSRVNLADFGASAQHISAPVLFAFLKWRIWWLTCSFPSIIWLFSQTLRSWELRKWS